MIQNYKKFKKFEDQFISKEEIDIEKNFLLVGEMYKEAVILNIFPLKNPLEDIEAAIKTAKVINSVSDPN